MESGSLMGISRGGIFFVRRQVLKKLIVDMQDAKSRRFSSPLHNLKQDFILYEILPWLTAKPLFRFKLVCKEWHKVISSEFFMETQSRRCIRCPSHFLYAEDTYKESGSEYDCILIDPSLKCTSLGDISYLISSSNGLLCVSDHRCYYQLAKYITVKNPFTGEIVSIANARNLKTVALAFEPLDCNPNFTLVSPSVTKTEQVGHTDETWNIGFTLYSSRTDKWRIANAKVEIVRKWFRPLCCKLGCQTVYTGGKIFWKEKRDVFWFHIKEDSGGTVSLPNSKERFPQGEIGDCSGEITYSVISVENIEIWVLRSNEKNEFMWVHLYCLSLRDIFKDCYGRLPSCCYEAAINRLWEIDDIVLRPRANIIYLNERQQALAFEGGDVVFGIQHKGATGNTISGVIFSYNLKTRALQTAHTSTVGGSAVRFFPCKSSLASVPKLSATATECK